MRILAIFFVCVAFWISGCSLKVVPQQVSDGVIDPSSNSLTLTREGISIRVSYSDREMLSYNLEGMITPFDITIHNKTDREIGFGPDSFILLDDQNRQHFPLTPDRVKEIVSRDSYYLIPYPYVGFYYLEDYERTSSHVATGTQLPYYFEVYPQDIYTRSLRAESIIPGANVQGLVYFNLNPAETRELRLFVFRKGTSRSSQPDFIFPFKVSK